MITLLLTVTAYCSTGHTCANGYYPSQQRHTIAARREWPLGTRVRIEGLPGTYVVEDRLAKRYDDRIDIFLDSKYDCLKWGQTTKKGNNCKMNILKWFRNKPKEVVSVVKLAPVKWYHYDNRFTKCNKCNKIDPTKIAPVFCSFFEKDDYCTCPGVESSYEDHANMVTEHCIKYGIPKELL